MHRDRERDREPKRKNKQTERKITGIVTEIKVTTRKYAMWLRVVTVRSELIKVVLSEEEKKMTNNRVIVACKWSYSLQQKLQEYTHFWIHHSYGQVCWEVRDCPLRSAKCKHFCQFVAKWSSILLLLLFLFLNSNGDVDM